jgi:hypothetical protein
MKTQILILLLALSLSGMSQISHSVKFNPVGLYFNTGTIEIGFREDNKEINISGSIPIHGPGTGKLGITDEFTGTDLSTNGVRAAYRQYKGGWYGEIAAKTFTMSFDASIQQGKIESYCYGTSAGIQIGYQYEHKGFLVDFGITGIEIGQVLGRVKTLSKTTQDAVYMDKFVTENVGRLPGYMVKKYSSYVSGNTMEGQLRSVPLILPRVSIGIGYKF